MSTDHELKPNDKYMSKKTYLVVFKLRDQISTFAEGETLDEVRRNALTQLEHYVTNEGSISAVLRNRDFSRDIEIVKIPKHSDF